MTDKKPTQDSHDGAFTTSRDWEGEKYLEGTKGRIELKVTWEGATDAQETKIANLAYWLTDHVRYMINDMLNDPELNSDVEPEPAVAPSN